MTRVGIFGVAHIHADGYLANLEAVDGVEIVGVSEIDSSLRTAWSQRHAEPAFATHEALVAAGVDAAIVCTTTNEHREVVEQLAAANVDILCEKPLATTVADSQAIVDVCVASGVLLMTAFPMRFNPSLVAGRDWIDEDRIGAILAFAGTNQGRIPTHYAEWFADPAAAGGGAVMDHVVHLVDIIRWWMESEPVEVYAMTNRVLHPDVAVETGGIVTVEFDNGVFATIDCSWSRPDGYPTWGGLTIEAVGTGGVFTIDAFAERLDVWSRGDAMWTDWGSDANQTMIDHFIGAVNGEYPLEITGADGLRATEVALAAYRSVTAGQPVEV